MKFNFIKRMIIVSVIGAALSLGANGVALPQDQRQSDRQDQRQRQADRQDQRQADRQDQRQADRQDQRQRQADRQQHQQRLNQYNQHHHSQQRFAQQREKLLQQQRRQAQLRFQQQYRERLHQDRINLQRVRTYEYSAPSYRYSRGGRYYQANQYGVDMLRQAVSYGYERGVRAGQADREDRVRFSFKDSYAYRDATYGYNGYHVDVNEYRHYFREGFNRGYQDGFYSRFQYGRNSNGEFSVLDNILEQVFSARLYNENR